MENASKALIIAGAILLSILLISLGIMIFNMATPDMDQFDQTEITSFNQKFTKYEGKRKGSEVRALLQEVRAYNGSEEAVDDPNLKVKINNADAPTNNSAYKASATYEVECGYATNGRVNNITIKTPGT